MGEIKKMKNDLEGEKINPRDLKMKLAREIITMYHGEKEATLAEENFKNVFQNKGIPEDIKEIKIGLENMNIIDLLVKIDFCSSKSEARRTIEQGGVKINEEKIDDIALNVELSDVAKIIQKGKRHFIRVVK